MNRLVLAVTAENAEALLGGGRDTETRARPPRRLPAKAHLAVVGTATVVGECELGEATRRGSRWEMAVRKVRRYRTPRPVTDYGLERIPRSFRYVR